MSSYKQLSDEFYKCTKRVIKKDLSTNEATLAGYRNDLAVSYNNLIDYIETIRIPDQETREKIQNEIKGLRSRLIESFKRLGTKIDLGNKLLDRVTIIEEHSDDEKEQPGTSTAEDDANLLKDIGQNISNLDTTINKINTTIQDDNEMDAIKVIETLNRVITSTYDGNPTNLNTFLGQLTLAKTVIGTNQPAVAVAFIQSRLSGKALEAIHGVEEAPEANQGKLTFIYEALKRKIKPDNSRIIHGKIKALRADNKDKLEFAKIADELADQLRTALIAESIPPAKAKEMAIEATVDMCRSNARSETVKTVIESKTFDSASEVISSYLIQIDKIKADKQVLAFRSSNQNYNSNNRYNFNRGSRANNYRRGYNNSYNNNRYTSGYDNNRNFNNRGRNNYNNRGRSGYNGGNRQSDRPEQNNYNNNQNRNVRYLGNAEAPAHLSMSGQPQNQSPNHREDDYE